MARVVVVGAGIIGLACARRLQKGGALVTVVDPAPGGDKCSFGNAGGIAVTEIVPASVPGLIWKVPGWLIDPLGPLSIRWRHSLQMIPWLSAFLEAGSKSEVRRIAGILASLNALVYDDLIPMLSDLHLSADLHRVGAIVLYSTKAAFERDISEWNLRSEFGIDWEILSPEELSRLEPDLSPTFQVGVFLPAWSHVASPKRIVDRLQRQLVTQGASFRIGKVLEFELAANSATAAITENGERLPADAFIIAAGAWSGYLAETLGDRVLLQSERGYNTTVAVSATRVWHELIFAEHKFVITPLEEGLRIGGAAEFAGFKSLPNFKRSRALLSLARQAMPKIPLEGGTVWMGNRPATPDSLPVIGASGDAQNVYYAFGHGHLGLTQAASTARLIEELVLGQATSVDLGPFSAKRFGRVSPRAQ
jgi:D-amino-acid dehydrogenase